MTKSNWNIKSMHIGTDKVWQCYRLKDWKAPMHSGNMIEDTELFDNKEDAARRCRFLNDELVWSHHFDRHPQSY